MVGSSAFPFSDCEQKSEIIVVSLLIELEKSVRVQPQCAVSVSPPPEYERANSAWLWRASEFANQFRAACPAPWRPDVDANLVASGADLHTACDRYPGISTPE